MSDNNSIQFHHLSIYHLITKTASHLLSERYHMMIYASFITITLLVVNHREIAELCIQLNYLRRDSVVIFVIMMTCLILKCVNIFRVLGYRRELGNILGELFEPKLNSFWWKNMVYSPT